MQRSCDDELELAAVHAALSRVERGAIGADGRWRQILR